MPLKSCESEVGSERDAGGAAPEEARIPIPPGNAEILAAVFRSARSAWNPSLLLPLWLYSIGAWLVWEVALATRPPAPPSLLIVAALFTAALAWPLAALAIALAAWEFGRGERLGLADGLRMLWDRLPAVVGGPLLVLGGATLLFAVVVAGSLAFGAIPVIGKALAAFWVVLPGLPLGLLATGLLVLGIPGLPLILAAGAVEEPFPFDAATRGMSYLRARPSLYLALILSGWIGAAAGTLAFAFPIVIFLLLGVLAGAPGFTAAGTDLAGRVAELGGELAGAAADFTWPFSGLLGLASAGGSRGVASVLLGRAVTAFAGAAVLACVARAYLFLRWKVDGEPPGSQVRPDEEFLWTE